MSKRTNSRLGAGHSLEGSGTHKPLYLHHIPHTPHTLHTLEVQYMGKKVNENMERIRGSV